METKYFTKNQLSEAAALIKNGGIVVMPTETVYGLAANALDPEAVKKIFEAKGRQSDNPLIVHIANIIDWPELVTEVPKNARLLAERFWPGPLTIILKKSDKIPDIVSGGLDTVAVRMPKNKIAFRFIKECGVPIAAPSANISGKPSPTKFSHALQDMDGKVDGIIDGGDCMVGIESTVISLATEVPTILRPGRITAKQIEKVIGEVVIHPSVEKEPDEGENPLSPGMKYKHYSPKADLKLVNASEEDYIDFIKENADNDTAVICYSEQQEKLSDFNTFSLGAAEDSITHAKKIFDILRAIDEAGLPKAFAPLPTQNGVGLAVKNRMLRASGFQIVDLNGVVESVPALEYKAKLGDNNSALTETASSPIEEGEEAQEVTIIDYDNSADNDDKTQTGSGDYSSALIETVHSKEDSDMISPESDNQYSGFDILEEDSAILALSEVKLSEDFNEDFSKEISDSIKIVEKTDEDDPTKIFYEATLNEDDVRPAPYPVDSIGDDFKFDVYDDDIEAERNRGLFSIFRKRRKRNELDDTEPEPFIPARNPVWNADRPIQNESDNQSGESVRHLSTLESDKRIYERIEGLRVIGITGKSGAGKSFIAKRLAAKIEKSAIIDADSLYHKMLESDSMILSLVISFGNEILDGKKVNRKKLAEIAFSSPENLEKLNQTVLPQVAEEIIKLLHAARDKGLKAVILDAPTLIESKLYQVCNEVIFIVADAAIRQERIVERDNITLDEIGQRMRFEKEDSFYVRYADRIIRND